MHEKAIRKIQGLTETILRNGWLDEGFPTFSECYDDIDKLTKEALKSKKDWLTRRSLHFLVIEHAINSIEDNKISGHKPNGRLSKILQPDLIKKTATSITQRLTSIPRPYYVYFPLPAFKLDIGSQIDINDYISIICISEKTQTPKTLTNKLTRLTNKSFLEPGKCYGRIQENGYIGSDTDDISFMSALSKFKQLIQFGVSKEIFEVAERPLTLLSYLGGYDQSSASHAIVIDLENPDLIQSSIAIPGNISKHISKINNLVTISQLAGTHQSILEKLRDDLKSSADLITSPDDYESYCQIWCMAS